MSVMSLIDAHLEQISLCAQSIAELSFPPPKIFTNALLGGHDITTLIRDTETHERALFSVPPPPPPKAQDPTSNKRRTTVFQSQSAGPGLNVDSVRAPRRNTAVAAVLGKDLVDRIRKAGGAGAGSALGYQAYERGKDKGEVDVEVLLEGAEKLCNVYPIPGAAEKIAALRQRHQRLESSLRYYEAQIAEQAAQLSKLNRPRDYGSDYDGEADLDAQEALTFEDFTEEDMRREEEEIKELERKKRSLEERVSNMEKDISGVTR
ncbi:uncharacterized protein PV09_03437 [Verruconis gallopava]|uniref:DASH complex subunit SPC34 n=1 Tax=Verruconis gallopava TaxID=253628 RepID=A0A0D2AGB0_9PEZI|nr:uncharacterized protein PV09_03437 [Verruconis gallopava]KIW05560.1 hypothetical protein PV09_03437 [Verruconis gallopava]